MSQEEEKRKEGRKLKGEEIPSKERKGVDKHKPNTKTEVMIM